MPHDPYKALYVHVPFCASRCAYCDFTTKATRAHAHEIDKYFERLVCDVRSFAREGELAEIETVYIGGGTPTHAGSRNLTQLLYALSTSMRLEPDVECTIEANPESLDKRLVADVWALGANRLSLGVQSFDDALLSHLGRIHSADDALQAIEIAHTRFENVSVDLMCGLPGQTLEQFSQSVERALSTGITHLSIYPLTIETGTPFARAMAKGRLELPSDDVVADMMVEAAHLAEKAGLQRYEVASYARDGYECRHNLSYWSGVPYLGIGHSAATMTQNASRRMRMTDGVITDDLDPAQMAAEDLMLAMRTSRGVSASCLDEVQILLPGAKEVFDHLVEEGLASWTGLGWVPTERGWLLGNEMYGEILDLCDSSR